MTEAEHPEADPPRWERRIACADHVKRPRLTIVAVTQGCVVLVVPAGEAAVMSPIQVRHLRAVLHDAEAELDGAGES